MKDRSRQKPETALFLLILLLILVILFRLTSLTPLLMDDFDYSFSWATGERLAGVSDVLASQAVHWKLWGGRSVAHTLAQFFLLMGKPLFNALNPVVYLLLLICIMRLGGRTFRWHELAFCHLALFLLLPGFGTVFLWLDGSCNYLWCSVLAMFPLMLTAGLEEGSFPKSIPGWIISILLCFLAGWTNENTACGVFAGRMIWLFLRKKRGARITVFEIISFAAEAAGILLLLFSPGNFLRASAGHVIIISRIRDMLITLLYVVAYASPLAVCAWLPLPKDARLRERFLVLISAGLLSGIAMLASPEFSPRSLTGMSVLLLSSLFIVLPRDLKASVFPRCAGFVAFTLVTSLVFVSGWEASKEVKGHTEAWKQEITKIEKAAEEGQDSVLVHEIPSRGRYTVDIFLSENPGNWPNATLGRYYRIQILKE